MLLQNAYPQQPIRHHLVTLLKTLFIFITSLEVIKLKNVFIIGILCKKNNVQSVTNYNQGCISTTTHFKNRETLFGILDLELGTHRECLVLMSQYQQQKLPLLQQEGSEVQWQGQVAAPLQGRSSSAGPVAYRTHHCSIERRAQYRRELKDMKLINNINALSIRVRDTVYETCLCNSLYELIPKYLIDSSTIDSTRRNIENHNHRNYYFTTKQYHIVNNLLVISTFN